MNSAAVEMLLQDVEEQLSSYSILLGEAYKSIDEKPVTDEEVKAFYGYKPKGRELMEAGRIGVKTRDKYKAKNDLCTEFCFPQQGAELLRLMEREAEDTIFEDGGAREAKAIAGAISRHIDAFNIIAPARARELYMKYRPTQRNERSGIEEIRRYMSEKEGKNISKSACQRLLAKALARKQPGVKKVGGGTWYLDIDEYELNYQSK